MTTDRLRQEGLHWLESDGEIVALDLERSVYLSTNSCGALLWSKLTKGAERDELAADLVQEFGIPRETAQADVDSFLAALAEQNLLET